MNLKKDLRPEEEPVVLPSQALKLYRQNHNQNHNQQNRKIHQGMQICKDLEMFHFLLLLMMKRRKKSGEDAFIKLSMTKE